MPIFASAQLANHSPDDEVYQPAWTRPLRHGRRAKPNGQGQERAKHPWMLEISGGAAIKRGRSAAL